MHYYDYHKIISYNCPVNILIRWKRRSVNLIGAKKFVIEQFIKKHAQFLYLRRYDNELKEIFEASKGQKDFFDDIKNLFPDYELKAKNRKFYINDEVFGFAKRMTEAQDLKSSVYQNVKIIIIDEYPIEKNKRYYLKDEGMILMGIIDSIIRNRSDIKIFILGNAVEGLEYSPLFTFFDLSLPYGNDIKLFKDNLILVQYMNNEEFRKDRENTLIGRLAKGTAYEKYAMQNKILDKNKNFIEHKSGSSKFYFALIYEGETYGIWNDYHEGKVYVSFDVVTVYGTFNTEVQLWLTLVVIRKQTSKRTCWHR